MMPLCTTASVLVQSTCGCAFISHGRPWVAHRVCAMPSEPAGEPTFANCASRFEILPRALQISRPWPLIVATPAESYPRYSSRFRAGTSTSTALLVPIYPTMPHIEFLLSGVRHQIDERRLQIDGVPVRVSPAERVLGGVLPAR